MRSEPKKIFAFIDSQNLNLGVKSQGWSLDFKKFHVYLHDKYWISRAFLFLGYIKSNNRLYRYLRHSGYRLIFKQIINNKGNIKGNIDAELIVHTMKSVYEGYCDKVIIVSGDGDFAVLADFLLEKNKLLKFITPDHRTTSKLIKKVFIKRKKLELLDSLNDKRSKLKIPPYRSGNR